MDNKVLNWTIPFNVSDFKKRFDFTGSDMICCVGVCKGTYEFMEMYFLDKKSFCNEVYVYWINDNDPEKARLTIY